MTTDDDQPELERRAHPRGALGARREAEQGDARDHARHRQPFPQRQAHFHQPRREHGSDGEVRRHDGLDGKKRQIAQSNELSDKSGQVDRDAGQEQALPEHANEQAGIDALTRLPRDLGGTTACCPDGDRLHDGCDAVAECRYESGHQAPQHASTLRCRQPEHSLDVGL